VGHQRGARFISSDSDEEVTRDRPAGGPCGLPCGLLSAYRALAAWTSGNEATRRECFRDQVPAGVPGQGEPADLAEAAPPCGRSLPCLLSTLDIHELLNNTDNRSNKNDLNTRRLMEPNYTYDDALAAAEALREISAGHEQAAQAVLNGARLDTLSNEELQELCDQFGVEPSLAEAVSTGRDDARWQVRLAVPRHGGWRAWAAISDTFERQLADQETGSIINPAIASQLRRGSDYVRVVITATVMADDIAAALDTAWRVFLKAAGDDTAGWDMAAATAEVRPGSTG